MKASYQPHTLQFKFAAGTSRAVLHTKPCVYLLLEHEGFTGIGECSTIEGLSIDPSDTYIAKLDELCATLNSHEPTQTPDLTHYPSIAFGLETALLDLKNKGSKVLFPSNFTSGDAGIAINGLIWMGDKAFMQHQIAQKLDAGYNCLKLKVGALDFNTELDIIKQIRNEFKADELEIRLDANGGFTTSDALRKLEQLSNYNIHSIEQPIKQGQWDAMTPLCIQSPIPIALDEELIGLSGIYIERMIARIRPQYIILKPSLLGGFAASEKWINAAEKHQTKWWITSALESNIGLNAIAQWTYTLNSPLPQGLGTGQLYHNNIASPLQIRNAQLFYNPDSEQWGDIQLLTKQN